RRNPHAAHRIRRVEDLLRKHHAPLIVAVRFMYGLRIIGPIVMGACDVPPRRFAVFNALGAALWAPLVGGAGYLFAGTLNLLPIDLRRFEGVPIALLIAGALLLW